MTALHAPSGTLLQHTLLEQRGGASRVARDLHHGVLDAGGRSLYSFELAETDEGRMSLAQRSWLERFLQVVPTADILHLHATLDWVALLQLLPPGISLAITLHDCRLLTGGCPYPLECEHLFTGCVDPCPRAFPDAGQRQARQLELLRAPRPLLLCPSRWMRNLAARVLPEAVIRCIPNGVAWPGTLPSKGEARGAWGLAQGARMVVFVAHGGEAAAYKGGGHWRRLWAGIKERCPQAVGFFVGGESRHPEKDLAVLPYLDRERLQLVLRAADLLLYPTLADNHPLIVLEAMAMGCPVAAWNTGGVGEQIEHGRTGMLAPTGDIQALTEAAAWLLDNPAAASSMGREAHVLGKHRFSIGRMVADHLKIYARAGEPA